MAKRGLLVLLGITLGLGLAASACRPADLAAEKPETAVEDFHKWIIGYPDNVSAERT